ncbi:GntR family transcriptional regulator [Microbacterium sp. NPDC056052]|uniref:GntR family transcriptional regulator n=1 Tax=Microbacterium sp. NPDC056052 TaxID=3345695 RepID=UPI0035D8232F
MTGSDFLRLDPRDAPSRGRTAWLTARIRAAVADATLGAGTRVPPSRELAEELSFSRGVVVEAYRRLTEEGLLVTNRGAGTRIAAAVGGGGGGGGPPIGAPAPGWPGGFPPPPPASTPSR